MTKSPESYPENPGSYNAFCEARNFQSRDEAMGSYALALDTYRQQLADYHGISLDDLHAGIFNAKAS